MSFDRIRAFDRPWVTPLVALGGETTRWHVYYGDANTAPRAELELVAGVLRVRRGTVRARDRREIAHQLGHLFQEQLQPVARA